MTGYDADNFLPFDFYAEDDEVATHGLPVASERADRAAFFPLLHPCNRLERKRIRLWLCPRVSPCALGCVIGGSLWLLRWIGIVHNIKGWVGSARDFDARHFLL
jgi:hypothetical protein